MKRWMSLLMALCLLIPVEWTGTFFAARSVAAAESGTEAVPLDEAENDAEDEQTEDGAMDEQAAEADDTGDEEGDDSDPVPLDMIEEEMEEETLEARLMQYGDEGDDVLELQTRLKELHYYTGNLSGRYREGTREAVKAFQGDFGLEPTGVADYATQSALFATLYRPLRFGSIGDDVKELQTRLTELGYYKGKISGNFLEATRSAVERFQEKNGLEKNGVADPDMQSLMFSGRAVSKSEVNATPTPEPDLAAYLVDEDAESSSVVMPAETVEFTKKLKNGSSGKLVKQLQERLTELGYYDGPVSGNFMVKTTRAVKAVQTQNGLESTGVVNEETWNVIFNDPLLVMPENTPKPTPSPTPVPFAITVDVENQVTTVYGRDENGQYTVVVRQMLCSTGMKATPSDVGDWVLNGRHATWCYFPKWGSYARYWTRINSSIAFHSVIYNAVSLGSMNTKSYRKLGQRASHGCIRLTVADAKWIFDNVGAGTVVSIVEHMEPDPELRDSLVLPPLNSRGTDPVSTPEPTPVPEYRRSEKPDLEGKTYGTKAENEAVYWAQRRLAELGYYTGKCSGKLLGGTSKALKAFQRAEKIYPDGKLDQKTVNHLYNALAPGEDPTPEPSLQPETIPTPAPDA